MSLELKSIKSIFDEFAVQSGLAEKINNRRVFELWSEIVGKKISGAAKVTGVENGTVYIETKSSTWMVELNLRKEKLINLLNDKLGITFVKDLIIK